MIPKATQKKPEDFLELVERARRGRLKLYVGFAAGVGKTFRMLQEVWAEVRWEPLTITDLGDKIVVETRLVAQGRGSDVRLEADEAQVFWFRGSSLRRLQAFPTKEEALAAAAP